MGPSGTPNHELLENTKDDPGLGALDFKGRAVWATVNARKLEHSNPYTPKRYTKGNPHLQTNFNHVPTFWSLL